MTRSVEAREATTVFPSRLHTFPPVTFFETSDAIRYAMSFAPTHGSCTCPALSFVKHYMGRLAPPLSDEDQTHE